MRHLFYETIDSKRKEEMQAAGIEPPKEVFSLTKTILTVIIGIIISSVVAWVTWTTMQSLQIDSVKKELAEMKEETRKKDKDHDGQIAILHQRITEESKDRAELITTIVQKNNDRFFQLLLKEYDRIHQERAAEQLEIKKEKAADKLEKDTERRNKEQKNRENH